MPFVNMQALKKAPPKHIINKYKTKSFTLLESVYPPLLKQSRHKHKLASFSFVLAGNYLENYGRQTQMRQPSTVIFHPPQESHAVEYESGVRILSVQFDSKQFARIHGHSTILDEPSSSRSETITWLGNRIHRELRRMDLFSILAIEGLVLELLAEASRSKTGANEKGVPRWLKDAKDFLDDNFAQSFTLEDVVKIIGVHSVHLSRVFRKQFGCTIGEYVRRLRVEFAARQISETDSPLGDIAYASGFADHSHFNRTFKDFYGLTPNQYRQFSRKS